MRKVRILGGGGLKPFYINERPDADADSIFETDLALWSHLLKHAKADQINYLAECFNLPRTAATALNAVGPTGAPLLAGLTLCSFQIAVSDEVLLAALERGEMPEVTYGRRVPRDDVDEFARIYWTSAAMQARTNPYHACGIYGITMEIAEVLSHLTFSDLDRFIRTFPHVWLVRYPNEFLERLPVLLRERHENPKALPNEVLIFLKTLYAAQTAHRERKPPVSKLLSELEKSDMSARAHAAVAADLPAETRELIAMHDRAVPEASFCDEIANIFPSFPKETRDKWIRIYLADQALDALIRHGMNLSQARIQSGCRSSLLPKIRTIAQKMNPGIVNSKKLMRLRSSNRVAIMELSHLEDLLFSALYLVHSGGGAATDFDIEASTIAHDIMEKQLGRYIHWPTLLTKTECIDIAISWLRGVYKQPITCPECGCVTYLKIKPTVQGEVEDWGFESCPVCTILKTRQLFCPENPNKEDAYAAVASREAARQKKHLENASNGDDPDADDEAYEDEELCGEETVDDEEI